MIDGSANYILELWEPFQALTPLFNLEDQGEQRKKAVNDSLEADLYGESPIAPPQSRLDVETLNLMYAILHIYSPLHRFRVYKKMFQYYPWRNRISKAEHFQSVYYLVAHECYIFEERLKSLLNALGAFALKYQIEVDVKAITKSIMRTHKKTFATLLRWRGQHVHEDEFLPRDINRIGLLGTFVVGEDLNLVDSNGKWRRLQAKAMNHAKKEWIKNCEEIEDVASRILVSVFRSTKPIWSQIVAKQS